MSLPLDDVTVVSLEQAVAAPFATRHLADLGARVIKIERPDGGDFSRSYDHVVNGESSVFLWLNRGKRSIALDLKDPAHRERLDRLLATADVLVANLAPRVLNRMGLTATDLKTSFPGLIVCQISGYDQHGPFAERKAYDALIQAECGLMNLTGAPDAPAKVGISIADIAAGSYAFSGVLAALRHRDRTGETLPVDVSLFGALLEWMSYPLYYAHHSGNEPQPMGTRHPTIAPYGAVTTRDGRSLMIAVQNEREWKRLCTDVLDAPEIAADGRFSTNSDRVANRVALDRSVDEQFGNLDHDEAVRRLNTAEIGWTQLNGVADLMDHPEVATPRRWMETKTPNGPVPTLTPTGTPGGRHAEDVRLPALGEHTTEFTGQGGQ